MTGGLCELHAAESVASLSNALIHLKDIWEQVGIPEEQRLIRTEVFTQHIKSMLDLMIEEEEGMKKRVENSLETCRKELDQLCVELGMPGVPEATGLTMLQLEKDRRARLEIMLRHKKERMDDLRALVESDGDLCDVLGAAPFSIDHDRVPSVEQLDGFRSHVGDLAAEKRRRQAEFVSLKEQIVASMEDLERLPETSFERDVVCEDEDAFCLSHDNIGGLKLLLARLEDCKAENRRRCAAYRLKIQELWERLQTPQEEREATSPHMVHCKKENMEALRAELERLEALKMRSIRSFVEAIRAEVAVLWDKCFYSAGQRQEFGVYYHEEDVFTEELLLRHEAEVSTLKRRYETHRPLFEGVARWRENWTLFLELDRKANDPARLNNRGGNLLKEQKQRADLQKSLPKLEKSLKAQIDLWEQECGGRFLVDGGQFVDYIKQQWAAFHDEKEKEKTERLMKKTKQFEEEVRFGAATKTPSKRRLPTVPTPSKVRKLNVAATPNSTLSSGSGSTICQSAGSRPPLAAKNLSVNGKASHTMERNKGYTTPLPDKNTLNVGSGGAIKCQDNNDFTFSTIAGTYSDFARDLSKATKAETNPLNSTCSHH
ncbi:protein regulator of cytokinesis 1-like isoform X1 [Gadus chalcogrammus]|uniref:protein regulator of cytokinesis 1-like isoform X1 n=1 Tax=Gadus chalcogrammus TaxID=1042646 RepID=UPI0024C4BE98|nr:protein regulator of cytokinesis 1-like isoform X1 [Gadus chalcogrammus]